MELTLHWHCGWNPNPQGPLKKKHRFQGPEGGQRALHPKGNFCCGSGSFAASFSSFSSSRGFWPNNMLASSDRVCLGLTRYHLFEVQFRKPKETTHFGGFPISRPQESGPRGNGSGFFIRGSALEGASPGYELFSTPRLSSRVIHGYTMYLKKVAPIHKSVQCSVGELVSRVCAFLDSSVSGFSALSVPPGETKKTNMALGFKLKVCFGCCALKAGCFQGFLRNWSVLHSRVRGSALGKVMTFRVP